MTEQHSTQQHSTRRKRAIPMADTLREKVVTEAVKHPTGIIGFVIAWTVGFTLPITGIVYGYISLPVVCLVGGAITLWFTSKWVTQGTSTTPANKTLTVAGFFAGWFTGLPVAWQLPAAFTLVVLVMATWFMFDRAVKRINKREDAA